MRRNDGFRAGWPRLKHPEENSLDEGMSLNSCTEKSAGTCRHAGSIDTWMSLGPRYKKEATPSYLLFSPWMKMVQGAERRRGSQQCGVGRQKVLALLDYICVSIKGHTSHYLNVKTWNSFPQRASTWSYSSLGALSHLRQHLSASTASQSADLTNHNSQVFPIFTFPDSDWAWSSQFTVSHQSHCMSVTTITHDHVFLGLSQLAHTIIFFFF